MPRYIDDHELYLRKLKGSDEQYDDGSSVDMPSSPTAETDPMLALGRAIAAGMASLGDAVRKNAEQQTILLQAVLQKQVAAPGVATPEAVSKLEAPVPEVVSRLEAPVTRVKQVQNLAVKRDVHDRITGVIEGKGNWSLTVKRDAQGRMTSVIAGDKGSKKQWNFTVSRDPRGRMLGLSADEL